MKRINNKGISLVELIITFALLMVIIIGMLNIVNSIKSDVNDKEMIRKITQFNTDIVTTIQKKLLNNKFNTLTDCDNQELNSICKKIVFSDNTSTEIKIHFLEKTITFDGITYTIPYDDEMNFLNNYNFSNANGIVNVSINNNFLIIDVPYYKSIEITQEHLNTINEYNYGFRVIYPINL